ncbi:hypothetical protein K469DRAFT_211236 [Zopfia rhizophila CBS 207.26]|uniref:Uncharacterized protein n=1 Tax=Zopfia rhizophila CBS 207.26 TaxID=1314779 RepID=A0A6A6DUL6_9PEZI|nr:hypothetical protein K469DRAFT_211236 [Zopfia rhizophila CBS 207.26]
MAYRLTNITFCHVSTGASTVTAIVRSSEMMSDSWLVGYWYNDRDGPNLCACPSLAQQSDDCVGWKTDICSSHGKVANTGAFDPEEDDTFEDGSKDASDADSDSDDRQPNGNERRLHFRTRRPWSKSDEQRLLTCECRMIYVNASRVGCLEQYGRAGTYCARPKPSWMQCCSPYPPPKPPHMAY